MVADVVAEVAGIANPRGLPGRYAKSQSGRKQKLGQVSNAYIRVLNKDDGKELARFDLSEDASTENAMVFGELYRNGEEWKFKEIG